MVMSALETVIGALATIVEGLDPGCVSGSDAARLTTVFERGERLCGAGKALMAGRAATCGTWSGEGWRSAEEWLSKVSGTALGAARATLAVAGHLDAQPEVKRALKAGEISSEQAARITDAVAVDPDAAPHLLHTARTKSHKGLADACREVTTRSASAAEDRNRHEAIHRSRYLRTWTDRDGAGRVDARLTPEALAAFRASLAPFERHIFDAARRSGERERSECYGADALVAMARAAGSRAAGSRSGGSRSGGSRSGGPGPGADPPGSEATNDGS
ncbi:MAG: hypothetical protein ACYC1D_18345, partial [Acidimicrobiales bacterium]